MQHDKELLDRRGRTPLHLAVSLGYLDCVKCLLRGGCDANAINRDGWNGRKLKDVKKVHGRWKFFLLVSWRHGYIHQLTKFTRDFKQ